MADVAENKTEEVVAKETIEKPIEKVPEEKADAPDQDKSNGTKAVDKDAEVKKSKPATEKKLVGKALESAIIRQVEYYFGDANLQRDKFLKEQISQNDEGWVPLSLLLTFNRLAALSTDADVVIDALSKSEEGLLEISEDRKQIRRHPERPLPERNPELRKEIMSRTAYVKGFPLDAVTSDLLEFFEPFEKVQNVLVRKYYDKNDKTYKFKGSVFVTFEKVEQAKAFVDNKEKLTYKDKTIEFIRKMQESYLAMKREERTKLKNKESKKPKNDEKEIVLPTGTVVHFQGITDDSKREDIREAIEKIDPDSAIAYIEFQQGQKEGKLRFQLEGQAAKFLEKIKDNKITIKEGMDITLRALGQEEEVEFLKQVANNMRNLRNKSFEKGNNRKRHQGQFNNKRSKKQKTENE